MQIRAEWNGSAGVRVFLSQTMRFFSFCVPFLLVLPALAAGPSIRRIDGTILPIAEADALALRIFAENHVTGAQIAVLNDGRLVWSAAYGMRDREHGLPMQTSTTTWAASITKSVFATYVMQLVERNQLSLDTPVADLLDKPLDGFAEYRESAAELVQDPRWRP